MGETSTSRTASGVAITIPENQVEIKYAPAKGDVRTRDYLWLLPAFLLGLFRTPLVSIIPLYAVAHALEYRDREMGAHGLYTTLQSWGFFSPLEAALMGAGLVYLIVFPLLLMTITRRLRLDSEGVTWIATAAPRRRIPWSSIVSVRRATMRESVIDGWLAHWFLPRAPNLVLTYRQHYRIEWVNRKTLLESWFFPPADEDAFRAAVARWAPHVLDLQPIPDGEEEEA